MAAAAKPALRTTLPFPDIPVEVAGLRLPAGSKEWCASMDALIAWFETAFLAVGRFVDESTDCKKAATHLVRVANDLPDDWWGSSALKTLIVSYAGVIEFVAPLSDTFKDMITISVYYSTVMSPSTNPTAMPGLMAARFILQSLRRVRIGTDWAAWITADISFVLTELEQLIDRMIAYISPMNSPSVGELTQAWRYGYVTKEQRDCLLKWTGHNPNIWDGIILATTTQLSWREGLQWAIRSQQGAAAEDDAMVRAGVHDPIVRDKLRLLFEPLADLSGAMQYARHNLIDDNQAAAEGRNTGFDDVFWPQFQVALQSHGVSHAAAKRAWQLHWTMPSEGQCRELLHRIGDQGPDNILTYGISEYRRSLRGLGYTSEMTDRLAATAYRVAPASYQAIAYSQGTMSDDAMTEFHLREGYAPLDAPIMTRVDSMLRYRQRAAQTRGFTPDAIGRAVVAGKMTRAEADSRMLAMGYYSAETADMLRRQDSDYQYRVTMRAMARVLSKTTQQVAQAQSVGIMDVATATTALTAAGYPASQASGIAQLGQAMAGIGRIRHAITHLRGAYLAGEISQAEARQSLQLLGVVPNAAASYLSAWAIEQTPNRKRRSTGQITADVASGIMTVDEAMTRLHNLGYEQPDAMLFMAEAQRKMVTTQAAMQAAATLGTGAGQDELVRLAGALPGLSRQVVGQLQKEAPPSKLQKWLKAGIVQADYVRTRLELYGWTEDSIQKWIEEVTHVAK